MTKIFVEILNMSISASWIIPVVLFFRLILEERAPKWSKVLLWGIVAVRLICPFMIESPVSLIPKSVGNGTIVSGWLDNYVGETHTIFEKSEYYNAAVAAGREPIYAGDGGYYVVTRQDLLGEPFTIENTVIPKVTVIWEIGVALLFVYTIISYLQLRQKVNTGVLLQENIYQSEKITSSFVLGVIRPRIYVPFSLKEQELNYVIAHEQAHISRKDHWWKVLGFALLAFHWFNPLIWISYILFCKDIELACDEKVIQPFNKSQRADYSQALLSCSVKHRNMIASPLFFGEVGVKDRVKTVLNYKKPRFWIVIASVMVCSVVAVCFLTNPETEEGQNVISINGVEDGQDVTPFNKSEDILSNKENEYQQGDTDLDILFSGNATIADVANLVGKMDGAYAEQGAAILTQEFEKDNAAFIEYVAQIGDPAVRQELIRLLVYGESYLDLEVLKTKLYALQETNKDWEKTDKGFIIENILLETELIYSEKPSVQLVMDRIIDNLGLLITPDEVIKYDNSIENITEDAVILLCQSESKKYTVYGFISLEYSKTGILIDYAIDGDNRSWNYFDQYTWAYSETMPSIEETGEHEGILRFTQGDGVELELHFESFETGHIEIIE